MASSQQIRIFLFLLFIVGCLKLQFSEGRPLKAVKGNELSSVKPGMQEHAKHATNVVQDQHATGYNKMSSPVMPTQNQELSGSQVPHSDVPQSTTPGNSPGVGHSFSGHKQSMQTFTSAARKTDGFQTLGHSPGVGHAFGNLKEGLKA